MKDKKKNISRRKFLNLGAKGYASAHLVQSVPFSLFAGVHPISSTQETFHGVCYHDCPDSCSWSVSVKDEKVLEFKANELNPFTGGKLCGKMERFPEDVTFHPNRILTPLKRIGKKGEGKFERISWSQALEEVSSKLKVILKENGGESVLPFGYMGTQGLIQKAAMSKRFFKRIGACNLAESICGASAMSGVFITNGQSIGVLPEDIVHSRYIILWGTNTKHSNVHLWPYVMKARKQGAKIIVVDPFESATAKEADWHVRPMPGTDVALALGMMHIIVKEGLADVDYIKDHTLGFEELKEHIQNYDSKTVSRICDIEEQELIKFAKEYAMAKPSLIRMLIGMEHNLNGGDAFRAVSMLPSITGAWRELGGGLMHFTFELGGKALNFERLDFYNTIPVENGRTINMVELGKVLNTENFNPEIKALFVFNSNPVVTIPNQNLIRKGMKRDNLFTVVLEHFITDTAKYADYIFPATSQLEHWDVADSWGQAYINLNHPAIKPLGESKPNSEFFRLLAAEMGFDDPYFKETDLEIAESLFDTDHPYMKGITFEYLRENGWARYNLPEPWLPHKNGNFGTVSGKCEFYSAQLEKSEKSPLPQYKKPSYSVEEERKYPLKLLAIKSTKGFHNSSHANVKRLIDAEGDIELKISEYDAKARNISNGDKVKAFNKNGIVILYARIGKRTRKGVVIIPHGYWPSLLEGGSSVNALTNDWLEEIGGGAAFNDTRVQIVKI
ncbi:molybdopterin-dependent oxidoreductase [Maribacter sp. PR1]|uniref:Molybdopterin-dependent oxidoreductase n=1 Tax=Maribacter cobaltidurans TaxID=1178778 RepID=A0ABU7IW14_9FLAO|nr:MULTISPECIES: molybdopterin-dependent oxidoreductase [Maribacter]MDC6389587.1 molybdopterin-dependent oxidoreductase [Maribacter sp. PR1]MEE1976976.1 molybdopterin-dependent oxidoreductase [Maribacter cobaltidurans]